MLAVEMRSGGCWVDRIAGPDEPLVNESEMFRKRVIGKRERWRLSREKENRDGARQRGE